MIKILTPYNVKVIRFPDGQPHVVLPSDVSPSQVDVYWPIKNPDDLFTLCLVSNALENTGHFKCDLYIPYLMGARYDRVINAGDSLDLKVVVNQIDQLVFKSVLILDPHSQDATLDYFKKTTPLARTNLDLVRLYQKADSVLIIPDKGAQSKSKSYWEWNDNIVDEVHCEKTRDLSNGNITLNVINPEKCADRHCVIIDDIYDGGGTFETIAKQIKPKSLTVIVTHSIFSKGYGALDGDKPLIDRVITTDSYKHHVHPRIHVVSAFELMTKERRL